MSQSGLFSVIERHSVEDVRDKLAKATATATTVTHIFWGHSGTMDTVKAFAALLAATTTDKQATLHDVCISAAPMRIDIWQEFVDSIRDNTFRTVALTLAIAPEQGVDVIRAILTAMLHNHTISMLTLMMNAPDENDTHHHVWQALCQLLRQRRAPLSLTLEGDYADIWLREGIDPDTNQPAIVHWKCLQGQSLTTTIFPRSWTEVKHAPALHMFGLWYEYLHEVRPHLEQRNVEHLVQYLMNGNAVTTLELHLSTGSVLDDILRKQGVHATFSSVRYLDFSYTAYDEMITAIRHETFLAFPNVQAYDNPWSDECMEYCLYNLQTPAPRHDVRLLTIHDHQLQAVTAVQLLLSRPQICMVRFVIGERIDTLPVLLYEDQQVVEQLVQCTNISHILLTGRNRSDRFWSLLGQWLMHPRCCIQTLLVECFYVPWGWLYGQVLAFNHSVRAIVTQSGFGSGTDGADDDTYRQQFDDVILPMRPNLLIIPEHLLTTRNKATLCKRQERFIVERDGWQQAAFLHIVFGAIRGHLLHDALCAWLPTLRRMLGGATTPVCEPPIHTYEIRYFMEHSMMDQLWCMQTSVLESFQLPVSMTPFLDSAYVLESMPMQTRPCL